MCLFFRKKSSAISKLIIILIVIAVIVVVVGTVFAVILLGFWQPFGRVVGSGDLVTEEKDFSDFTIVEVGSGFEVEITQSSSYSINVTADDNVLDHIEVSKSGVTLRIRLKLGYRYQSVTLRAEITMPELYELQFSGGAHGTIAGFTSSHEFVLELSGGSHLSGDFTTSGNVQFLLSGGSRLIGLDGAANDLHISASGKSGLGLSDFPVHDATVNLSGGSSATINLDGNLDADLSEGSSLGYIGDPTMGDIKKSIGSTIEKIG